MEKGDGGSVCVDEGVRECWSKSEGVLVRECKCSDCKGPDFKPR